MVQVLIPASLLLENLIFANILKFGHWGVLDSPEIFTFYNVYV